MNLTALKDEIKLKLTGQVLEMEIDDTTLDRIINSALRELQRYICSTRYITIPYKSCIDLSNPNNTNGIELKISSVSRIFRSQGMASADSETAYTDPFSVSIWQSMYGLGYMNNFQNAVDSYLAYNTQMQMRNTMGADLSFRFDRNGNKLYVSSATSIPQYITLEYVPRCDSVEDVTSDYWIDMLAQMSVALTKIIVGRIRTRYTQSNALWTQDGAVILEEGQSEYKALQEYLRANTQLVYGID